MRDLVWEYDGYDPAEEGLREALCALGNGYFATRGAAPESDADAVHYPGTYAAGCYDRATSVLGGREVENEDMVNLPNWLPLRFRCRVGESPFGPWFSPDADGLLAYRQSLDLRGATMTRRLSFAVGGGRRTTVVQTRLTHMADPHLAALRTEFTAEDWQGQIEVESALDGNVTNAGVERYLDLIGHHLTDCSSDASRPGLMWLRCRTRSSDIGICLAARSTASTGIFRAAASTDARPAQRVILAVGPGDPASVEKTVDLHITRGQVIPDPLTGSAQRLARAPDFAGLLDSHHRAWEQLWRNAELDVPGEAGRTLRLHLLHLLQTLSPHTTGLDVGVPARGLHGEAYRGHVFWDELFVLPFLNTHLPEISRALLEYRYRRLPQARTNARKTGRAGAMYPWQSGSDGREETQSLHLNPRSGRWLPDHSRLQHHIGSAVARNIWQYAQATGDMEFLRTKGAEMLLEIARFWADLAQWDPGCERYRIRGVVGPDEYHDAYPDAARPGLDDNTYTNVTACWVLTRALEVVQALPRAQQQGLYERLGIGPDEPDHWDDISRKLHVPFHDGVISQFDGYADLDELDWDAYRGRYGNIRRLDRLLEAEGDSVNRYRASKQADVLMLGYFFTPDELARLMRRLGHPLSSTTWRRTVDYYLARTSHGSTLSALVHGWVLARARHSDAWTYFQDALAGDVADVQGGTTAEGIHLGAMAGTLDLCQRGLAGLETCEDALWLDPVPLPELSQFGFTLRYRNHRNIALRFSCGSLDIGIPATDREPLAVVLAGRRLTIRPGENRRLDLR